MNGSEECAMSKMQFTRPVRAAAAALSLSLGLSVAPVLAQTEAQAQTTGFVKETLAGLDGYNVYRPVDLSSRARPAPLVVWANGGCVKRDLTWVTLFERWAAAGNVVVTIHDPNFQPPAAMADPQAAARAAAQADPNDPAIQARMRAGAGMQAKETAEAQRKAIDWAEAANRTAGTPYTGKLDLTRVVAAGNSCGGISSLNLAASELRVKSVFVLSGSSIGPGARPEVVAPVMSKVAAPVMWVVGGPEDVARAASEMDFEHQPKEQPGLIVYRSSFDHRTVSTDPATLREVAEMGVDWFRATLYGDHKAAAALTTSVCAPCSRDIWSVKAKHFGSEQ
jgi:dienelactone hydrolase